MVTFPHASSRAGAAASCWYLIDPRVRILFVVILSTLALASFNHVEFLLVYLCVGTAYLLSGTSARTAWKGFRPFAFLIILTAVLQMFFTGGAVLNDSLPLLSRVTREGLFSALLILTRLSAVILLSTLLVAGSSPHELSRSLGWFFSPLSRAGVPVGDLMLILNLAFQFFPILAEETQNVRMGLESRGISLRHDRIRLRLKATAAWILAVLTAVLERSHRTAAALQIKEGGGDRRLRFRFPSWNPASTAAVAMTAVTVSVWALLRAMGPFW